MVTINPFDYGKTIRRQLSRFQMICMKFHQVIVIDHHRRDEDFPENTYDHLYWK